MATWLEQAVEFMEDGSPVFDIVEAEWSMDQVELTIGKVAERVSDIVLTQVEFKAESLSGMKEHAFAGVDSGDDGPALAE